MFNFDNFNFEQELGRVKKLKGRERGSDLIFLIEYIKRKQGEKGYRQLREFLAGHEIDLPESEQVVDKMSWIPLSLTNALILGAVKLFGWQKGDIIEMGKASVSLNFTIKFFIKYFASIEKTFKRAAQGWKNYFTIGRIEVVSLDKKNKRIKVRLKDFHQHKILCFYFIGTFSRIIGMAVGSKNVQGEETKCSFSGDNYHEFVFQW